MSARTLTRRFQEELGTLPLQWRLSLRSRRAQELLESTDQSIDRIGEAVGFPAASAFRERFRRDVGTSPGQYRRTFVHARMQLRADEGRRAWIGKSVSHAPSLQAKALRGRGDQPAAGASGRHTRPTAKATT